MTFEHIFATRYFPVTLRAGVYSNYLNELIPRPALGLQVITDNKRNIDF